MYSRDQPQLSILEPYQKIQCTIPCGKGHADYCNVQSLNLLSVAAGRTPCKLVIIANSILRAWVRHLQYQTLNLLTMQGARVVGACGGTPLFGLNGDMPLKAIGLRPFVLNRVYNFNIYMQRLKQGICLEFFSWKCLTGQPLFSTAAMIFFHIMQNTREQTSER